MKNLSKVLLLVGVASSLFLLVTTPVSAQQNNTNGLRISPVRNDITISPGSTQTLQITLQNVTSSPIALRGVANDFISSEDESGTPRLILDDNQYAPSHSLKRFVGPIRNLTLKPNEQQVVTVSISVPNGAAGGGYYGVIRFLLATSNQTQSVSLSASVGSIVLLKVPGDIKEQLSLASMAVHQNYTATNEGNKGSFFTTNKNLSVVARFQNEGNVQEEPFGKLTLKKGKKVVQTVEINNTTPRGNVLPDSIRKFNVPISKVGSFGKYTVEGAFGYGAAGQLITGKTTFYVVPVGLIIVLVILLVAILAAIFGLPRLIKDYNRRIIRNAQRSKRRR